MPPRQVEADHEAGEGGEEGEAGGDFRTSRGVCLRGEAEVDKVEQPLRGEAGGEVAQPLRRQWRPCLQVEGGEGRMRRYGASQQWTYSHVHVNS